MDIPEVLALLTQHGIRQADLVQRLRVSKSLVSMWFSGEKPITPSRLPDLWELAALARDARAVGDQGRDALARWHPTTLVNRRQSGGKTFTSTWNVSAPSAQWPLSQTLEDYGRFWLALRAEGLESVAGPDCVTFDPDAATLAELRSRVEMACYGIDVMQVSRAQMPLPRQA